MIINLVFSVNIENSFLRNIFFIKYIIFTIGTIDFFSKRKIELFLIFKIWILILTFFSFDLFVQFITQKNIIGLESPLKYHRVSGFMGDELKAGSLILFFCFIVSGYLIDNDKNKIKGLILLFLFIATIFITGDRSNFLKSIVISFCLIFFIDRRLINKFIILFLIMVSFVFFIISTQEVFKARFNNSLFKNLSQNNFNIVKFVNKTEYGKIFNSAYQLFLKKKTFGVGNKNFRILCEKDFQKKYPFTKNLEGAKCNTHPHQIYFEILVEHGIFGFSILIITLLSFIYQNFRFILKTKNFLLSSLFFSNLVVFIPILPGGSFFTSFNAIIFWLNISLFYAYKNICKKERGLLSE